MLVGGNEIYLYRCRLYTCTYSAVRGSNRSGTATCYFCALLYGDLSVSNRTVPVPYAHPPSRYVALKRRRRYVSAVATVHASRPAGVFLSVAVPRARYGVYASALLFLLLLLLLLLYYRYCYRCQPILILFIYFLVMSVKKRKFTLTNKR